jgi:hypothetical protein
MLNTSGESSQTNSNHCTESFLRDAELELSIERAWSEDEAGETVVIDKTVILWKIIWKGDRDVIHDKRLSIRAAFAMLSPRMLGRT